MKRGIWEGMKKGMHGRVWENHPEAGIKG